MKITFINPKIVQLNTRNTSAISQKFRNTIQNNPNLKKRVEFSKKTMGSLGLLTLAALVPKDIEVEFIDENMEEINFNKKFDLVAITGNIGILNRVFYLCDIFKSKGIPVVAGGPLVSTFPDEYTRREIPIIKGEGELLFKIFLNDFLNNKVKEVYDNSLVEQFDMSKSPMPRFDLASKYDYSMVGVHVSRGCPYDCNFCHVSTIFGKNYRLKPVSNVIEEIKLIKKYWKDNFFYFYDDNPFFDRKFAIELFDKLYNKENIDLGFWGTSGNITLYKDIELMKLISSRGELAYYGVGLESLSTDSLKSIGNQMKLNQSKYYAEAIKILKEYNINPVGFFMFGYENSKLKDIDDIVNFAIKNKIEIELSRLTPLPGTRLYKDLLDEYEKKYGKLTKSSISQWGRITKYLNSKINIPENIISESLTEAYIKLYSDENYNFGRVLPISISL